MRGKGLGGVRGGTSERTGDLRGQVTTEKTGPTHRVRRELYSVFCVIPRTATHARKINDERGGLRTREGTRGPGSHSQRMPVVGEDLGAQDPGPSALSRTPGPPHGAAEVAFSSRTDPGSAEVLECPPRYTPPPRPRRGPIHTHFRSMSLAGTYTPPETSISPLTRQLVYPDSMKGGRASVGAGAGEVASPPLRTPLCSGSPAQAGARAERVPLISCFPARDLPSGGSPGAHARG